jgi:hypothetical protein
VDNAIPLHRPNLELQDQVMYLPLALLKAILEGTHLLLPEAVAVVVLAVQVKMQLLLLEELVVLAHLLQSQVLVWQEVAVEEVALTLMILVPDQQVQEVALVVNMLLQEQELMAQLILVVALVVGVEDQISMVVDLQQAVQAS